MTDKTNENDGRIVIEVNGRHASTWPEVKEALGLNPAGPADIGGVEVIDVVKSDDGLFTHSVTLRFDGEDTLDQAKERLFEQASEMFEYGIHDEAGDVQDFAADGLPNPIELEETGN